MAVKSRREEYAALTRAALVEAAADLFVRDGFDVTSVDDIASAARVSKGAVYHHFPDKKAIFDEVFRVSQKEIVAGVEDDIAAGLKGADRQPQLAAVKAVQGFLDSYVKDERKRSLLKQSAGVLGVQRCRAIDDDLALPLVIGLLEELADRGELQDVSIKTAASVIFGTLCEAATSLAIADDPEQAGHEATQVVIYMLLGLVTSSTS